MLLTVLQASAQSLSKLEYWFDSHVSSRRSIALSGDEDYVSQNLSTDGLSVGLHWLNMRTVDTHGVYSGITTSPFLKSDPAVGGRLEYWFDDNYDHHHSIAADATSGLDTKLDLHQLSDFPLGVHRLNFRLIAANGQYTPISTAYVLRLGGGEPAWLEYWLDDDQANSRLTEGSPSGDGSYAIVADLDLNEAAPGFHRLYYRAASQSTHTASAVSMTPIMVKSMYGPSANDLEVTAIRYWVDDNEPVESPVLNASPMVDIKRDVTVHKMSDDIHTINIQARNSGSLLSEVISQMFTLLPLPEAQVNFSAKVTPEGFVSYSFNSLPNDLNYKVLRFNGTSTEAYTVVGKYQGQGAQGEIHGMDLPANGTYTYQVLAKYTDEEGDPVSLRSNTQTITMTNASEKVNRVGAVYGTVSYDKLYPGFSNKSKAKTIRFSYYNPGGEVVTTVNTDENGRYALDFMPLGHTIYASIENDDFYTFYYQTFTLDKNVNNGTKRLDFVGKLNSNIPDDFTYDESGCDIYINSGFTFSEDGRFLTFKAVNNSYETWRGQLGVFVHDVEAEDPGFWDKISYTFTNNDRVKTPNLSFNPLEEKEITLCIANIRMLQDIDLESTKKFSFKVMSYEGTFDIWKDVGVNSRIQITNPFEHDVKGFDKLKMSDEDIDKAFQEYLLVMENFEYFFKYYINHEGNIDKVLYDRLKSIAKPELLKKFEKDLKAAMKKFDFSHEDRLWDYIKLLADGASELYDLATKKQAIIDASSPLEKMYAYTCFVHELAQATQLSPGLSIYSKVLSTYYDVGKALAQQASNLKEQVDAARLASDLQTGMTWVIKFHHNGQDVQAKELSKVISSITLEVVNLENIEKKSIDDVKISPEVKDGVIQLPIRLSGIYSKSGFILSIKWANGRITKVPILKNEEIDAKLEYQGGYVNIDFQVESTLWNSSIADKLYLCNRKIHYNN